jgi:hypothetical protein
VALADDLKGLDLAFLTGPFCALGEDTGGLDFVTLDGTFYATPTGGGSPPAEPGVLSRVYPGMVRVYPGLGRVYPI